MVSLVAGYNTLSTQTTINCFVSHKGRAQHPPTQQQLAPTPSSHPPVHKGAAQHALLHVVKHQGVVHVAAAAADVARAAAGTPRTPRQRGHPVGHDGWAVDHYVAVAQALQGCLKGLLVGPAGCGVGAVGAVRVARCAAFRRDARKQLSTCPCPTTAPNFAMWVDEDSWSCGAAVMQSLHSSHTAAACMHQLELRSSRRPTHFSVLGWMKTAAASVPLHLSLAKATAAFRKDSTSEGHRREE